MWYNVRRGFTSAQVESQSKAKGSCFKIRGSGEATIAAKRWCAEVLPLRKSNLKARPRASLQNSQERQGTVEIKLFGTDAGGIILKISPGDGPLRVTLPEWSFYVYIAAVKPQNRGGLPRFRRFPLCIKGIHQPLIGKR